MKIGIALSGGGVRAAAFHIGTLRRLAADDLLEDTTFISTVSGGSLCVGLIYCSNGFRWPTSNEFVSKIQTQVRNLLTSTDLQKVFKFRTFKRPWTMLTSRAQVLAKAIEDTWRVHGSLLDIPDAPRWIINATSHETAKNWRFMSRRMGDYEFGYSANPDVPLSHALAASAAIPVLVGPLILDTGKYEWFEYLPASRTETRSIQPKSPYVHLWDGALYDNLGIEALLKRGRLQESLEFLIVSDAGLKATFHKTSNIFEIKRSVHDIPASQVSALRGRILIDLLDRQEIAGRYFKLGNTADYILHQVGIYKQTDLQAIYPTAFTKGEITEISHIPTTARRLSVNEFDALVKHGYEVADCTLHAYSPQEFSLRPYS